MKRGLCLLAVSLLLGNYAAFFMPAEYLVMLIFFLLVCGTVKWVTSRRTSNGIYAAAALFFALGSFLLLWRGDVEGKKLYPFLDEYIDVTAEVAERPQFSEGRMTFEAKILEMSFLEEHLFPGETVRLSSYEEDTKLAFGDTITARIRLNLPNESSNRGGFDYSRYLKTKNIFFTGYIDSGSISIVGQKKWTISDRLKRLGYRCGDIIDHTLPPRAACILKGVLLGDKSDVDDELYQAFSRSGLSHIVAVSGTHISSLLVMIFALFGLFGVKRRRAGIFALALLCCFICLIGAPASAVRAGIMAALAILAEFIYRKADTYISLAVAAIMILCIQPFASFDVGFLLSFGAVLGILLFQKKLEGTILGIFVRKRERTGGAVSCAGVRTVIGKMGRKAAALFATAISAQLMIVPLLFLFFQEFTFWGLITNFIVLPLLPFLLSSGALLCIFGLIWEPLSFLPAGIAYLCLLAVRGTVLFFGNLSFGVIVYGKVTAFFAFFYSLFPAVLYLLYDVRKRVFAWIPFGSAVVLICVLILRSVTAPPLAYVRFINVGQGDCSCISLPDGTDILIDAGGTPSYRRYYDIGGNIVRPYLLQNGIYDIEYAIASHGHDDHIQGLMSILNTMKVEKLLVPKGFGITDSGRQLLELAHQRDVPVTELAAGDEITFSENSSISVLMPTADWAKSLSEEGENERSLILRFDYGENSVLYTGDIEKDAEQKALRTAGTALRADVLKVPHHGGASSSSRSFLEMVQPAYAVIPVGKNNFGHPDEQVLSGLYECGSEVFRTDKNKDVVFTLDLKDITEISYVNNGREERK